MLQACIQHYEILQYLTMRSTSTLVVLLNLIVCRSAGSCVALASILALVLPGFALQVHLQLV